MISTKRIFSGIQPTGIPHIGNYLGAIKNWVNLQSSATVKNKDVVMFCIVDLHSCTTFHDPKHVRENIHDMVASLIACGIDPKQSLLFQQSQVPYHTELAWFLSCLAPTGQLKRMHQWKSKAGKEKDGSSLGLFSYPVLMAADILLYKSTHVPVGHDQLQHIELARDLTEIFNRRYAEIFPLPEAILTDTSRVMSLRNPTEKMSKSEMSFKSRIDITDEPDTIASKIRKAVTDSDSFISRDLSERHGVRNLVYICSAFSGQSVDEIVNKYIGREKFTQNLKADLTDLLVDNLRPIRKEFFKLRENKDFLERTLLEGCTEANNIAVKTMNEIHDTLGLR